MAVLDFSDLKGTGQIIKYNNEPYQIIWSNFMRTAQRKPVIQAKLRNLMTGKVMEYSFKYGEKIDEADVGKRKCQYLYSDGEGAHFMNPETFEALLVPRVIVEDQVKFLKEGSDTVIMFFEDRPIALDLRQQPRTPRNRLCGQRPAVYQRRRHRPDQHPVRQLRGARQPIIRTR